MDSSDDKLIEEDLKTRWLLQCVKGDSCDTKLQIDARWCLEGGADVNARGSDDDTPLHVAVRRGDVALVDLLLKFKANVDIKNSCGDTSLHVAVRRGDVDLVNILLKSKPKVNSINNAGNTPLHLAARQNHSHIADLLLRSGADFTLRNLSSDTSLTVTRVFNFEGYEEISSLLETAESLAQEHVSSKERLRRKSGHKTLNNSLQYITQPGLKYVKRAGTSGVSGHLYETKLLCLFLIRVLNDEQIEHFQLGTNIDGVGALDDICLRYQVRGQDRPVMLFVQAKHKEDPEKGRLTVNDVRKVSGDFSLWKYLESYTRIKNRFLSKTLDPMFKGNFDDVECHIIIYTPLKDNFTKKKTKHKLSTEAHNIINTGPNTGFQYDHDDEIDYLTEITAMERLKKIPIAFLKLFMSKTDKTQVLVNKFIARNHVIMARNVLQPCEIQESEKYRNWQFRPSFLESDSKYLMTLKSAFIKAFSLTRYDKSGITYEDMYNCEAVIESPCASQISEFIGKLVLYDDTTKKLALSRKKTGKSMKKKHIALEKLLNKIVVYESIINEAVQIRLSTLVIKLPMGFGNLDMVFRGNKTKKQRRMKAIANRLFYLFAAVKTTKIVDINDSIVGPGKALEPGMIGINGGIGSAVGNLLVLDTDAHTLKFDLDNEALPENAALFLKELKSERYKPINEQLGSFRFRINIEGFPKYSFIGDESDKNQARSFLSKLWFYTNQAQEDETERILKNHINIYYNNENDVNNPLFEIHSNAIFLKCHDKTQKWWMEKDATSYLSRENDIFGGAKLESINTFLLAVIGYIPHFNISSIDFKFNQRTDQNITLSKALEAFNDIFGKQFDIFNNQNKSISIRVKEEIMTLLQTTEYDNASHSRKLQNLRYTFENNSHIVLPRYRYQYFKRSGTSGVSGQLYKTKLLCLVFMRALNDEQIEHFLLGTNIHGFDAMDDICLRYRVKGQDTPVVLFVQAKHKKSPEKGIFTVEYEVEGEDRSDIENFIFWNYFASYLTIKERFQANNEDPMFEGAFSDVECNLLVYTPLMVSFEKQKTDRHLSEKVHSLMNTEEKTEVFQFDYNEEDLNYFIEITTIERLKKMGIHFLESVMSKKTDVTWVNTLLARYHVVMGQKVLQPCRNQQEKNGYRIWEFRPEFFESDCKYLSALKDAFYRELSTKRYDVSNLTDEDIDNWRTLIKGPNAFNISKIIGKLATYNNKTKRLQLELKVSAFTNKISKVEFEALQERLNNIICYENIINEAVQIKLTAMEIKLPLAFGNLDMTFRGSEQKVKRRIKTVANKLIDLLKENKGTKIVDINNDDVGPGRSIERGILDINGGIGSAVGNILVTDTDTKTLKFDLDKETVLSNAALFLKELLQELKNPEHMLDKEKLDDYRFKIKIDEFPRDSFHVTEFDKEQAKDFFDKLWFYTIQAQESKVELIVKQEIDKYHNKIDQKSNSYRNFSDPVFLKVHDDIQKWWMQVGESHYITRSSQLFERAELADVDNLLLTVINFMFVRRIYCMNINIEERATDYPKFIEMHQIFNRMSSRLFQIFDSEFDEAIDITLPDDFERCYEDCAVVAFRLEIHPEMEWVAFKLLAKGSELFYFVIAKAERGSERCLLQQQFNGRSNYFFGGGKDPLD